MLRTIRNIKKTIFITFLITIVVTIVIMVSPEKEDEDITANILNAEFGNVDSKDLNSEDIIETYENKIKDIGSIDFNHDIEYIIKKMLVKKILRPYDVEDFIELRDREELHTSFWHSVFGNNISMEEDKMELINIKLT